MDTVAERAVAIGYPPDGRAGTVAKSSPWPGFPEGTVRDQAPLDVRRPQGVTSSRSTD